MRNSKIDEVNLEGGAASPCRNIEEESCEDGFGCLVTVTGRTVHGLGMIRIGGESIWATDDH